MKTTFTFQSIWMMRLILMRNVIIRMIHAHIALGLFAGVWM